MCDHNLKKVSKFIEYSINNYSHKIYSPILTVSFEKDIIHLVRLCVSERSRSCLGLLKYCSPMELPQVVQYTYSMVSSVRVYGKTHELTGTGTFTLAILLNLIFCLMSVGSVLLLNTCGKFKILSCFVCKLHCVVVDRCYANLQASDETAYIRCLQFAIFNICLCNKVILLWLQSLN